MEPSPKAAGLLLFDNDPICADKVTAALMGFDDRQIPCFSNRDMYREKYAFTEYSDIEIISNDGCLNKKEKAYIMQDNSLGFEPTIGWEEVLGNPRKEIICQEIRKSSSRVVIFGTGKNGRTAADYLYKRGIKVEIFCDNDIFQQGKKIWNGVIEYYLFN